MNPKRLPSIAAALLAIFCCRALLAQMAVTYINISLTPGFNLVSSPLRNGGKNLKIEDLLLAIQGNVPDGLTAYLWETNQYVSTTYDAVAAAFAPADVATREVPPGKGFFVFNPGPNALTVTFVGEIQQGILTNHFPAGFSILSSIVPQEGNLERLGFQPDPGDIVYKFNPVTQRFISAVYDDIDNAWLPQNLHFQPAEAFILYRRLPGVWTRTFFVNP